MTKANEEIKTIVNENENGKKSVFDNLFYLDVNDHVEKKDTGRVTLSYLSWAWAWAEVKKRYENASYEIVKDANGLPYFGDPRTGIMVYTRVTIDGITHEMWLPVMDSANNAMKFDSYEIQTRYGTKTVAAATMFDINKTIMRCLVKNLAMFGLGLYIYAGEDLPEENEDDRAALAATIKEIDTVIRATTKDMSVDEKRAFANEVIVPKIGSVNYKSCRDLKKLKELLDSMKSAA